MARIRTIKPEFPQSESMGRVSRDARLLFIMLWTIADDSGRLRGNSRMLASLLFPYDDDAKDLLPAWLSELDAEGCIACYRVGSDSYIEIRNWLNHQKIDRPSKSKIPSFDEPSRGIANPRKRSSEDQRNGSKDQGEDQDQEHAAAVAAAITNLLTFAFCPATRKPKTEKTTLSLDDLTAKGIDRQVASDFLTLRKAKRAPLTPSAFDGLVTAWAQADLQPEAGMRVCVARGWQGFDPSWVKRASKHDLSRMVYEGTPDDRI